MVIRTLYHTIHFLFHRTLRFNPFIRKKINGRKVIYGHIRLEQETNPLLDNLITEQLNGHEIPNSNYNICIKGFKNYLEQIIYPENYFGNKSGRYEGFIEKALEHFVSIELLKPLPEKVYIDIGAGNSPFSLILEKDYRVIKAYCQDIEFKNSTGSSKIGGSAAALPFPDNSIDGITLHCSLEHFEGTDDKDFFIEAERVLKKSGKCIVLPLYLSSKYTIHLDPGSNALKFYHPDISDDLTADIRYCNSRQHFSRHYDVNTLKKRIINHTGLHAEIVRVMNFKEVNENCYLRFIGIFTKV